MAPAELRRKQRRRPLDERIYRTAEEAGRLECNSRRMQRRQFLHLATSGLVLAAQSAVSADSAADLALLEAGTGGRLGVYGYALGPGRAQPIFAHRERERFPLCSTFKLLAVAAVLRRVDAGREQLGRRIAFGRRDLLDYAPVTRAHVARGSLTVAQLCAAALELSDNTAANLLLESIGGPAHVTRFARSIGDATTRLDRSEPDLNSAIPGDPRDTTSPEAIAHALGRLSFGQVLSAESRARLTSWLIGCQTGDDRLRAGAARGWRVGDKTGSGDHGTSNDLAIFWPPHGTPAIVAVYLTEATVAAEKRDAVIAAIGRIACRRLSARP